MEANTQRKNNASGFTIVELLIACAIFPIVVIGFANAFGSVRSVYTEARQYNEIYAVLSACPELDRAVDYSILSGTANCYPNNSFPAEDGSNGTITYTPSLSVTDTTSLPNSDPLNTIPDSKVVQVNVSFLRPYTNAQQLQLRMLITRNGLGQL